jgi:hypothetical protein
MDGTLHPTTLPAGVVRDQIREIMQPGAKQRLPGGQISRPQSAVEGSSTRDTINVADIEGTRSKALISAEAVSNFKLDSSDIEGSWPGWKPPFR